MNPPTPMNIPHKTQKTKWATFPYYGPDMRIITKLFRNTNIKIAYKTTNTTKRHFKSKDKTVLKYSQSGIYQLKCKECPLKYIGQTGCMFKVRYKEHIQAVRTNKQNSKFAQYILDTGHTHSTIDQTMKVLHIEKKGQKLNTLE
jgi:radical SAM protein with 4Fe4S-binding SPASM domain